MAKNKKEKEIKKVVRESETDKIRKMDESMILKQIKELKQELFNLRFQAAVGKLENTASISKTKKQIARMKTVLTERANADKIGGNYGAQ
ncbi:MAG TPA: 50S ribosomal protein L29 [Acholeplasmataceae bacterium]|jgi:large subunit ribosomal protein L29|nr:50S ribosomal protein L29 [Acholeplasmataceae bacterium]